jgi:hypothetical protein
MDFLDEDGKALATERVSFEGNIQNLDLTSFVTQAVELEECSVYEDLA